LDEEVGLLGSYIDSRCDAVEAGALIDVTAGQENQEQPFLRSSIVGSVFGEQTVRAEIFSEPLYGREREVCESLTVIKKVVFKIEAVVEAYIRTAVRN
jgi:hypothetical protein